MTFMVIDKAVDLKSIMGIVEKSSLLLGVNIILSLIFAYAIYAKLLGEFSTKFKRWGFGRWFFFVAAGIELSSIIGLYFRSWQIPAWMMLMTIIVGALITLLRNQEAAKSFILPLSTLGVLLVYFLIIKLY